MDSPTNRPPVADGSRFRSLTTRSFFLPRFLLALLVVLFSLIGTSGNAGAVDKKAAIEDGFALRLAAISPDGGWETPSGRSAASGAELVFRQINASRKGLRGFEVLVEKIPQPGNIEEARRAISRLRAEGILAVVCFASEVPACYVAQAASESGMPLILCHSEAIALGPTPRSPHPVLFGLDLEKSFRPVALAMWAGAMQQKRSWSIFIDRVDPYLSLQGEDTENRLKEKRIDTKTYWFVRSSVADIVGRLTESTGEGSPWIISWLSPIMSLRIYSTARRNLFPVNLVHADTPSDLLRPHDGIFILDQDVPLCDEDLLKPLGDRLWLDGGTAQANGLNSEAVRAVAAFQWIRKALEGLPGKSLKPKAVAAALEKVTEVQVENLSIPLSPRTHRPRERQVSVMVSKNGEWKEVERLTVASP